MVDQSVVDYINRHRKQHGTEALRKFLIENGHRKEDVEEAIRLSDAVAGPPKKDGGNKKIIIILVVCLAIFIILFVGLPIISLLWMSRISGLRTHTAREGKRVWWSSRTWAILR